MAAECAVPRVFVLLGEGLHQAGADRRPVLRRGALLQDLVVGLLCRQFLLEFLILVELRADFLERRGLGLGVERRVQALGPLEGREPLVDRTFRALANLLDLGVEIAVEGRVDQLLLFRSEPRPHLPEIGFGGQPAEAHTARATA